MKHIIIIGAILRLMFLMVGAPLYYSARPYFMHSDSIGWMNSILNLFVNGTYTANQLWENGLFYRPPGYSFFLGICYMLSGFSVARAYVMAIILQACMDVLNIFLVYSIVSNIAQRKNIALYSSAIYCLYPFTIVWTGVATAEILSVTLMLSGIYFFTKRYESIYYFLAALCVGFAGLTRPQVLVLLPPMMFCVLLFNFKSMKQLVVRCVWFGLGVLLSYGWWPLRNYALHHRVVFIQDVNIGNVWSPDWFAFMQYIFAVQTDIEPQATQLINNKKITWPAASYKYESDGLLLQQFGNLLDSCGTGVSYFRLHKGTVDRAVGVCCHCDSNITYLSDKLVASQQKHNRYNYYVKIPLQNLSKGIFKSGLYGNPSLIVMVVARVLFGIRTLLILIGVIASIYLFVKHKDARPYLFVVLSYFVIWYAYMCWIFRNIEVRYFLNADVLLLISAAMLIGMFIDKKINSTVAPSAVN